MFKEIFMFEIRYRLKQWMFYIFCVAIFLLSFIPVSSDSVQIGGEIGADFRNSPFNIMRLMLMMSVTGIFIITAYMSNSVLRDKELNSAELFYTRPITKFDYLFGRFSGSLVISFLILCISVIGIVAATQMPHQDPAQVGSFVFNHYLFSLFFFILPNVFILGTISFSLATLTKNILYTYISIVVIMMGYGLAQVGLMNMEKQEIASLIDPTGIATFFTITKYWTIAEKNTLLLPLKGLLLYNRLIWCSFAFLLFGFTYYRFRFTIDTTIKNSKKKQDKEGNKADFRTEFSESKVPAIYVDYSLLLRLKQLLNQTKLEILSIIKSAPFIILLLIGNLNIVFVLVMGYGEPIYGRESYPLTFLMIDVIQNAYLLIAYVVITFYTGELIWKERSKKVNDIYDTLSVPDAIPFLSKLFSLFAVIFILLFFAMLTTIGNQIFKGFMNIEIMQYIKSLFLFHFIGFVLVAVLGMIIQTIVNNKFIGYMFMVIYFLLVSVLPDLSLTDNLYFYTQSLSVTYSDMNGFGPIVKSATWFSIYRLLIAVILCLISLVFWVRGTESNLKSRFKLAKCRFNKPLKQITGFASVAFLMTGSYIFYNTHIINDYENANTQNMRAVEYERLYKKYEKIPQPSITDVRAEVDIYPEERNFDVRSTYTLKNKTTEPIKSVHITIHSDMIINSFVIQESIPVLEDSKLGYYIFMLGRPLQPGDSLSFSFDVSYSTRGFVNSNPNIRIIRNGTFFNNLQYFPQIGYNKEREISDRNDRKKYNLPSQERMPSVHDKKARMKNYIFHGIDWINFETTVSTVPEQIAVAPGYLQREWIENGRRYFHYKMDSPMLNFFSYQSAEYTVQKDRWQDVTIEIYYHKDHNYNINRMIAAIKKGLAYFSKNFSPYQFKQFRVLEFPRYALYAQSFANTVPYSESAGFINKFEDPEDIDFVFYITAHELAHQWWAHQVVGADVQGTTLMSETLAQYSALMVMEKEYGSENMRKFLKYELDEYLDDRGAETRKELPLYLVENQPYIHYNKGSLVMYALKDYIGEETLNKALARYIRDTAYQKPPYTTSLEFLEYIGEATPDSLEYIIEDMFKTITLYDNKAIKADYTEAENGKYKVTLIIETKKLRADSLGNETEIPINDWIYIGIFGDKEINGKKKEKQLYLKKHKINKSVMKFTFVVDELPVKAGIDPYSLLIDRNWDNNLVKVERKVK